MTVLLVDDYADGREVWALYLEASGFEVMTSADGVQGLETARSRRPDIIVMDLQMPGLSGVELAVPLRADPETRHIPLIAMTGRTLTSADAETRALFDSVVVKPCDPLVIIGELGRLTHLPESGDLTGNSPWRR